MTITPREIIKQNGGARAIASKLNMKTETVRMWQFRKTIPRTAWPELIEHFPAVTLETLKAAEATEAAKREQAA